MNYNLKSPPSLTATPPSLHRLIYPIRSASNSSSNTHSTPTATPAIIPLDYNYQIMSPSSISQSFRNDHNISAPTTANTSSAYHLHSHSHAHPSDSISVDVELDNQYSSLFGDPVPPPPPPDFLTSQFDPVSLFRTSSLEISSGSDEDTLGRLTALDTDRPGGQTRLFSNVPFSSIFSRRNSDATSQRNFDVLPTPVPRLQPPDIQILPNSSGGSSSEARETPNYAFLAPDDMASRPSDGYVEAAIPSDVTEIVESLEIRDAKGVRDYSEATRRVSNFSEDFKSHVGSLSNIQEPMAAEQPLNANHPHPRKFSNESGEWFRPATQNYPEFSKIPRMRPSSKNIMSIKREEMPMHHSPVAAMINDSNGSSSGEERLVERADSLNDDALAPARPPDPSPSLLREIENELFPSPHDYLQQQQNELSIDNMNEQNFPTPPPPAAPPPPPPEFFTPTFEENQDSIKREMSPVILRDSIATGSDFRVDQPRLHKKTSFTIISQKSPQSSRVQTPSSFGHQQRSPSKISIPASSSITQQPIAKPRQYLQRKSLSSTHLKLPQLSLQQKLQTPADDSPRPSVQFNMTGRHTPNMMTQGGILQHRESLSSSQQDITPMTPSRALMSKSKLRRPSTLPTFAKEVEKSKMKSCEALPFITDPYRTAIPRLNRSITDLSREPAVFPPGALPRPLKPNPNPTRKQKGLLRILNGDASHIPLRSNWASMDDLTVGRHLKATKLAPITGLHNRRRSSSTSPERRSSTQTASDRRSSNLSSITTSDFSFRRPSVVPAQSRKAALPTPSPKINKRRQSLIPAASLTGGRTSRAKIAKPTTLSPIIGTPNKDGSNPQSPDENGKASVEPPSETPSDVPSRRDSLSKIPVRATQSRPESRSTSPLKDFTSQLPLFDSHSRGTSSRTASRATARNDVSQGASRNSSRPESRSTSRASTRPISRAASRASTRPNSRMEMAKEIANSRSNSRMSMRSNISTSEKVPSSAQPMRQRRKSVSVSPVLNRKSRARRQSLSPPNKKRSGSRGRGKKVRDHSGSRNSSQSRIPLRASSLTKTKKLSPKPSMVKGSNSRSPTSLKVAKSAPRTSPTRTPASQRKKSTSAKKAPTSVLKSESSVKRTPSSVGKQAAAVKKQPSNLEKESATNLRRETSNLQKIDAGRTSQVKNVPKEGKATAASTKKIGASSSAAAVAVAASGLKRQATSKSMKKSSNKATASTTKGKGSAKTTSSKNDTKKMGEATKASEGEAIQDINISQQVPNNSSPIGREAAKVAAIPSAVAAGVTASNAIRSSANISSGSTGSSSSTTTLKRNPSNVSLKRMASRMSLLSMKRSDSNLSRKTTVPSVTEETSEMSKTKGKSTTSKKSTQEDGNTLPAAILEKSQKTLENIQMTGTNATDEIHKTINENLTDLRSLETDMGLFSDSAGSPTSSVTTVIENKTGGNAGAVGGGVVGGSVSRSGTAEGPNTTTTTTTMTNNKTTTTMHKSGSSSVIPTSAMPKSPLPNAQPIEAAVSVLNAPTQATIAAAAAAAATAGGTMAIPNASAIDGTTIERSYAYDGDGAADKMADGAASGLMGDEEHGKNIRSSGNGPKGIGASGGEGGDGAGGRHDDITRRSPDGQGGSTAGSGNGSREFLKAPEDDSTPPPGCCRCCAKFCLPCRRLRCSQCCRRKTSKTGDESEEPVLSATSTASTTNLEVIDEVPHTADGKTKTSCWQKLNCCKSCRKKSKNEAAEHKPDEDTKMTAAGKMETTPTAAAAPTTPTKQGKCGLCMSKLFCCRRVNKVDPITGDETELKKCCFCIPCRRKRGGRGAAIGSTVSPAGSVAWQDLESGIAATDASVLEGVSSSEMERPQGCCKRFWSKLLCCHRKKVPKASESRRASMKAPPPPSEDTRRKLHVDLVEYNSKMKGAIPVLPLSLAWFCAICNTIFPGLGTLFSGIFCLCVGIPRFSQYDSAKARFGSFIINIIVSVAQLFCVLFCFVGWGWSIWWGTIMLKCARKLSKIKKVERLEMEEEKRQAEAAAAAASTAARVAANTAPITTTTTTTTESTT